MDAFCLLFSEAPVIIPLWLWFLARAAPPHSPYSTLHSLQFVTHSTRKLLLQRNAEVIAPALFARHDAEDREPIFGEGEAGEGISYPRLRSWIRLESSLNVGRNPDTEKLAKCNTCELERNIGPFDYSGVPGTRYLVQDPCTYIAQKKPHADGRRIRIFNASLKSFPIT